MEAHAGPRLIIEVDGQRADFVPPAASDADSAIRFKIGKNDSSDFVCSGPYASREHAEIEFFRNDFFLVDTSTNGTYVQSEDERVSHVHRDKVRLWGSGWLSLGSPLHAGNPIHFCQG